jgi:hypothetical protein
MDNYHPEHIVDNGTKDAAGRRGGNAARMARMRLLDLSGRTNPGVAIVELAVAWEGSNRLLLHSGQRALAFHHTPRSCRCDVILAFPRQESGNVIAQALKPGLARQWLANPTIWHSATGQGR